MLGGAMLTLECLQGKTVTVEGSSVKIVKQGILSSEGEKTLLIRNISTVEVRKPSKLVVGYIRFFSTGQNFYQTIVNVDGLFKGKDSYDIALKMKKYIEQYKDESPSVANVSAADEILKLKALMDNGIISLEEFNTKKQLLGI